MAGKPERKPPPKPTKKMTQTEQSERFKETARQLGVDESGDAFERALRQIIRPKGSGSDHV
jgi:hypothetical protein